MYNKECIFRLEELYFFSTRNYKYLNEIRYSDFLLIIIGGQLPGHLPDLRLTTAAVPVYFAASAHLGSISFPVCGNRLNDVSLSVQCHPINVTGDRLLSLLCN